MNKLPINESSHQPNTPHTVMEKPLWLERTNAIIPSFVIAYFAMIPIGAAICPLSHFFGTICFSVIPLLLAVYIDKHFMQKFYMKDWERSKQFDNVTIRDIPIHRIRDMVEWIIDLRAKIIHSLAAFNFITLIAFYWFVKIDTLVSIQGIIMFLSTFAFHYLGNYFALKKFGFCFVDIEEVSTFNSSNLSPKHVHKPHGR